MATRGGYDDYEDQGSYKGRSPSNQQNYYDDDEDDEYEDPVDDTPPAQPKSPKIISEIYTSENKGDPDAAYARRKKEKKSLLTDVFMFEGHRYRVYLSQKGIHWTRFTVKGRSHFMDYRDIIGVQKPSLAVLTASAKNKDKSKETIAFKVYGVSSKQEKMGTRKPLILSFGILREYSDGDPDVIVDKWSDIITQKAAANRPAPSKKLLVLINPFSGKKEAVSIWKSVKIYLKMANISYKAIKTECQGHAYNVALNFTLSEHSAIICVSGDGLLNEVINGIFARKDYREVIREITFGVIPAGSGNGLLDHYTNQILFLRFFQSFKEKHIHWIFLPCIKQMNVNMVFLMSVGQQ
jgi:hypothetical protein